MTERLPATRMALLDSKERARLAERGAGHLRGKRRALAAELLAVVREVVAGREELEARLRDAVRALALARALDGEEALASMALVAARDVPLEIAMRKVWGVPVPEVRAPGLERAADARGASPLGAELGLGASEAARRHERALEALLAVCAHEVRLERLGAELRATSRRINAIEQLFLPALNREIDRIELALEEQAREDLSRRKRLKARRAQRMQGRARVAQELREIPGPISSR
jgi:V/A-type H+-transporting ATPase subunit D